MRFFTPKRKESIEPLAKLLNWRSLRRFLRRFILFRVGFARGSIITADAFNEVPQGMRNPANFGGVLPETYHD